MILETGRWRGAGAVIVDDKRREFATRIRRIYKVNN